MRRTSIRAWLSITFVSPLAACSSGDSISEHATPAAAPREAIARTGAIVAELKRWPSLGVHVREAATLQASAVGYRLTQSRGKRVGFVSELLEASLAPRADRALRLSIDGRPDLWLEVSPEGLDPVPTDAHGNATAAAGAALATDLVQLVEPGFFEEIRILRADIAPRRWRYRIRHGSGIAAIQVVDGRIRAVDATGYAHFSTAPALALDVNGLERTVDLRLLADSEGAIVEARVDIAGLTFPVAVDPAWSAVASMTAPRRAHRAIRLADGKVLVAGGDNGTNPVATTEVYDPKTNAWQTKASLKQGRLMFGLVQLSSGDLLAIGGGTSSTGYTPTATVERYDTSSTSPSWNLESSALLAVRAYVQAVVLPAGGSFNERVMVVDGLGASSTSYLGGDPTVTRS